MEIMIQWDKGNGETWPVIDRQTGDKVGEIRRYVDNFKVGYQVRRDENTSWSYAYTFPAMALAVL